MTDTDRDLAVIADYMRGRGATPLPPGLMAAARERALRPAPRGDTARTQLAAFWTRGPIATAGALGALATVAVLVGVLSGLPLGGTNAPAADPSLDGQPSSSPAASTNSTVICGRIEADACQTAIDLVRDGHPREVAAASAIVVDDTCPPDAVCDRELPFEVAVVVVPAEGVVGDVAAFRVFGAAGPEQVVTWTGALPRHVIRLIPGAPVPAVVEPSPSPEGRRLADPIVIWNGTDRPITLLIDRVAVNVPAGAEFRISTREVPPLPFRIEARLPAGRVVLAQEVLYSRPFVVRTGLTCGLLDVWSAPTQPEIPLPDPADDIDCDEDPELVAVPTQAPVPAGTPAACPAALIEGTLVADERWGMALAGTDGIRRKVLWPHGYTARREAGGLVLYDAGGSVVAREGDVVSIGGGETGSDGSWLACGGISVVSQAEGTAPASTPSPVPTAGLGSLERSDLFWDALALGAETQQQWPTLAEVVEVSDLVVRGRVTDIRLGRTVAVAGIQFALTTVQIEEVLKGTPATRTPGTIEVEWWLANGTDLSDLQARIPEDEALFFLVNQGLLAERLGHPEDVEEYRYQYAEINGAQGTLRDIDGLVRPLHQDRIGWFPEDFVGDSYMDLVQLARDAVRD